MGTPELGEEKFYINEKQKEFTMHTIAHLASCMFMDMDLFREHSILGMVPDAGSDLLQDKMDYSLKSQIGAYSRAGSTDIEFFKINSPGKLWDYCKCRFKMEEGSLMALGSACNSRCSIPLNKELALYSNFSNKKITDYFENIFLEIESLEDEKVENDKRFSIEENKISMCMKMVQEFSVQVMIENILHAASKYNIIFLDTYLALAGGFSLNCPTNSLLLKKFGFKGFIAPPCVSDTGMSLGIGLNNFFCALREKLEFRMPSAYLGSEIKLEYEKSFEKFIEKISPFCAEKAADDIINSPVVWLEGRAEIGPRALGARSLLSFVDLDSKNALNDIKQRQWWRPVAPIVLEEKKDEWIEDSARSEYMLRTFNIVKEKRKNVKAIVHLDGSARVQTINKNTKLKFLFETIQKIYEITSIPLICNTSLNDKGEPIINNLNEALNFALRKNIKVMYCNGYRIKLKNFENYYKKYPLERKIEINKWENKEEKNEIMEKIANIDKRILYYFIYSKKNDVSILFNKKSLRQLELESNFFYKSIPQCIRESIINTI